MENTNQQTKKIDTEFYIQIGIVAVLALIIVFSAGKIYGNSGADINDAGITGASVLTSEIIPTGVPAVYGSVLGVSYDDVSASNSQKADATISLLGQLDNEIELSGADLERYIYVLYKLENGISCEYCCGARAIIFEDGSPACGCAHSYAMRGLTKYLIKNYKSEYTDEELLAETGKWKVLFFPGIHETKAQVLEANGIDSTDYINLASNKYRGIEQGKSSGGAMVGGC